MFSKDAILRRVQDYYNLPNKGALARFLGVTPSTLSNWISRDTIDYELIFTKCKELNYEYLLSGDGFMLKKKLENFSEENSSPELKLKTQAQTRQLKPRTQAQKQYDPNDGLTHDFSAEPYRDQQQINTLNKFIAELQRALEQKNELLAVKDELLKSKDQTIAAQIASLKLLEGQMNATTALIEELTRLMGNETKKRSERADARDASDADARR